MVTIKIFKTKKNIFYSIPTSSSLGVQTLLTVKLQTVSVVVLYWTSPHRDTSTQFPFPGSACSRCTAKGCSCSRKSLSKRVEVAVMVSKTNCKLFMVSMVSV